MLLRDVRKFIGKIVIISWKDPSEGGYTKIPEGRDGLATWTELGYLKEIKKGVAALIRGVCWNPGGETVSEYSVNHVPLVLIESVSIDLKQFEEDL